MTKCSSAAAVAGTVRQGKIMASFALLLALSTAVAVGSSHAGARLSEPGDERAAQAVLSYSATYFASPGGSDANPGTEARPWRTLGKAAATLVAGDTVYIKTGTYRERVVPRNGGSAGMYITYEAYPGAAVTLDGAGIVLPDDLAGLFELADKSYVRVSGLRVTHAGPHADNAGILVLRSSYITVENNSTYDTTSSGIGVWGSEHVTVAGNTIEQACNGGHQECLTVAGTRAFEVRGNRVLDCHKEGLDAKDGAADGKIFGNQVLRAQAVGIYVDAWDKHTYNIEVFANTVRDSLDNNGFALASEAGGLLENVRVYNNLAYHNRYCGLVVSINGPGGAGGERPMRDIFVLNNTFYDNGWETWGGGIAVDNPDARGVVLRNNACSQNLYFQIAVDPGVASQNVSIDHNLIDGFRDTEGETRGQAAVEGDARFVNAAGGDFHLRAGSPAIDRGSAAAAPRDDFDGRVRPLDGDGDGVAAYDIGAYEAVRENRRAYLPAVRKAH